MCTLLFLTLVRRHHTEAALQQFALSVASERLRVKVARRAEQQQFMAMLVHEIRGPLTVIELGNRALTQRVLDAAQTAAWAQRMHNATDTIGQIVENCDQVDRLEAGALLATMAEMAIAPMLSDTLDRLRHTVPGAAERIHTVYLPESLRYASCRGDPHCVGIILRNLMANALKYAPAGSAVLLQVSAVQQGARACIEFAVYNDQGASGAPDPARVFSRYYRAQSATHVSGTGLGLWLSQNLARQMHSEIRLALVGPKIVFSFVMDQASF
jgi:signal transduction histidine kinase